MAIVFISPKKRQMLFISLIAGFFILVLGGIGLDVYLTKPQAAKTEEYFVSPAIKINWDVLKSDQLTNLEPMPEIQQDFQFSAKTSKGLTKTGIISAGSQDEATQILKGLNLLSITLSELKPGRANPFVPYYQVVAPPQNNTAKTNTQSNKTTGSKTPPSGNTSNDNNPPAK